MNNDHKIILTPLEVKQLLHLIELTEAKLEYERLVLKSYRATQKIPTIKEYISTICDLDYGDDVYKIAQALEYFKLLLANYELADPQTDTVEIGSYVSVYNRDNKKEFSFLVVQENRMPSNEIDGIKCVSSNAPIADAIMGKKEGEAFSFVKPNGKTSEGFITELNNEFCKQNATQKKLG